MKLSYKLCESINKVVDNLNANPLEKVRLLTDWIDDLEGMKKEAEKALVVYYNWAIFKEFHEAAGLIKVFKDEAKIIKTGQNWLFLEVPIKPLVAVLPKVRKEFNDYFKSDVQFQVRVSPNTKS
jgi:hypothetical protein